MRMQSFLTSQVASKNEPLSTISTPLPSPDEPDRLRVLLIGPRQGVISTIHTLHVLGFAESGNWSPLLPGPQPGTVISILTRKVT